MPSLSTHLIIGLIMYPVFSFIYVWISNSILNSHFFPDPVLFTLGYILFTLGSDLPDVDARSAPIRKFIFSLMTVFMASLLYASLLMYMKNEDIFSLEMRILIFGSVTIFSFIFYSFIQKLLLKIHRGIMHSSIFAIIYACTIYLVCFFIPFGKISEMIMKSFGLKFKAEGMNPTIYLALSGYFGVMTHLISDYIHGIFNKITK